MYRQLYHIIRIPDSSGIKIPILLLLFFHKPHKLTMKSGLLQIGGKVQASKEIVEESQYCKHPKLTNIPL